MRIWVKCGGLNCFVGHNPFRESRYQDIFPTWPFYIRKTFSCLVTSCWIRMKSSALVHSYLLFKCVSIFLLKGVFCNFFLVLPCVAHKASYTSPCAPHCKSSFCLGVYKKLRFSNIRKASKTVVDYMVIVCFLSFALDIVGHEESKPRKI